VYQLLDLKLYIEFTFASIVGLLFMIRLVLDLQICVSFEFNFIDLLHCLSYPDLFTVQLVEFLFNY
jgi:hypothetical protein